MSTLHFICQHCDETLAVFDDTAPVHIFSMAHGVEAGPDGEADCPACGKQTVLDLGDLRDKLMSEILSE